MTMRCPCCHMAVHHLCNMPHLQVAACGVVDLVTSYAKSKEERTLKKGDGAKRSRLVGAHAQACFA